MKSIYEIGYVGLEEIIIELGEKKFRAKQIWDFITSHRAMSIDDITNISKSLRDVLKTKICIFDMQIEKRQESKKTGATKYLIRLHDGQTIEAVRLKYDYGYSICISTQVGCSMGCTFCASTIGGLERNIMAYEMIEEIALINAYEGDRIGHVVLMGMGEPLDNYDEVRKFLSLVNSPDYLGISHRNITMSTCGLVDEIKRLADEKLQITLAISLHNPFDEERSAIMPINRKYNIAALMGAIDYYIEVTNRRVSIEYALIAGVNDTPKHALALVKLFKNKLIHINLIPINPISERNYNPTDNNTVYKFRDSLERMGINATVRRELGDDIDGACGQLRRENRRKEQ